MKLLDGLNEAQQVYHAAAEQEPGAPHLAEIKQSAREQINALHRDLGQLMGRWRSTLADPNS
ncbi:hypothetical protein O1L68_00220 [Streptomyces lydicus]|nr:hypothetical protein [Streptomyces lydicus]